MSQSDNNRKQEDNCCYGPRGCENRSFDQTKKRCWDCMDEVLGTDVDKLDLN